MNEEGVPIRPPASAYLFIDSRDRIQSGASGVTEPRVVSAQGNQPYNQFTIEKRQPFVTGYFTRIACTEVRFPWISPNVNPYNNEFVLQRCSTGTGLTPLGQPSTIVFQSTLTVPTDFYYPVQLADTLSTLMNTADPAGQYDVNFSPSGVFDIVSEASSNNEIAFIPSSNQDRGGLVSVLNLASEFLYTSTFGTSSNVAIYDTNQAIVGNYGPKMSYTDYVDVCSRSLTQYQKVKDNSTRENQQPAVLYRIYTGDNSHQNYTSGDINSRQEWPGCAIGMIQKDITNPKYMSWSPGQYVDKIDIELRDDNGRLLFVPNNIFGVSTVTTSNVTNLGSGANQFNNFQMTFHCSET